MDATFYWDLFMETGAPEAYLMYRKNVRSGEKHRHEEQESALPA